MTMAGWAYNIYSDEAAKEKTRLLFYARKTKEVNPHE